MVGCSASAVMRGHRKQDQESQTGLSLKSCFAVVAICGVTAALALKDNTADSANTNATPTAETTIFGQSYADMGKTLGYEVSETNGAHLLSPLRAETPVSEQEITPN